MTGCCQCYDAGGATVDDAGAAADAAGDGRMTRCPFAAADGVDVAVTAAVAADEAAADTIETGNRHSTKTRWTSDLYYYYDYSEY